MLRQTCFLMQHTQFAIKQVSHNTLWKELQSVMQHTLKTKIEILKSCPDSFNKTLSYQQVSVSTNTFKKNEQAHQSSHQEASG